MLDNIFYRWIALSKRQTPRVSKMRVYLEKMCACTVVLIGLPTYAQPSVTPAHRLDPSAERHSTTASRLSGGLGLRSTPDMAAGCLRALSKPAPPPAREADAIGRAIRAAQPRPGLAVQFGTVRDHRLNYGTLSWAPAPAAPAPFSFVQSDRCNNDSARGYRIQ